MGIVCPKAHEHRPIFRETHPGNCFVGQAIGEIFPVLAGLDRWDAKRVKIRRRPSKTATTNVDLEPMPIRVESRPAGRRIVLADTGARQVPFSEEPRVVTGRMKPFGKRHGLVLENVVRRWRLNGTTLGPELWPIGPVLSDVQPCRSEPGDHRCTRRRTDRCRSVRVSESHALASKSIDIRRVEFRVPLAVQIRPTHVIGHDQQNIRRGWRSRRPGVHRNTKQRNQRQDHRGLVPTVSHTITPGFLTHRTGQTNRVGPPGRHDAIQENSESSPHFSDRPSR